ncbi:MAG: non-homologous end-joining DNA ligase [Parachlamydiales bacterium]|jgi:DNA ligase D-like protein (predicted ligase)
MKEKFKIKKQPEFIKPQLATLTKNYFSNEEWIYEEKFDGIRCIAVKKGSKVTLFSRNKNILNERFPSIVNALIKQKIDNFIIDGEIVAFDNGITSFAKLQQAYKEKMNIYFYVFDLLYLDKYDLMNQKLLDRKALLEKSLEFDDKIRFTKHIFKDGEKFYRQACKKGLEGIMAKKADSKYLSRRTNTWLKFKCINRQEFIIVGFTDPEGERIGFGSLLLGYFENGKLKYAGKVGTGYNFDFLKQFSKKLKMIEIKKSYFPDEAIKNSHFVKLNYVGEVGFTEWTNDNKLRHPRFLGLREDKKSYEVVKES